MTYVIKHAFKIESIPYYVKLPINFFDGGEFYEVFNPSFATKFDTKENAKEWIDTYSPVNEYSKVVRFDDAVSDFENWSNEGMIRRTFKSINTSMSRPYNGESLDDIIDWWIYAQQNDQQIRYEHYKTWPKLYEKSKHLMDVSSYWADNYSKKYISFEIYTRKAGVFADFKRDIDRVFDLVTLKNEEGYLIFPIFDHCLSENGNSVSLLIHPETKDIRVEGKYLLESRRFSSLETFFDYMKRERYYE